MDCYSLSGRLKIQSSIYEGWGGECVMNTIVLTDRPVHSSRYGAWVITLLGQLQLAKQYWVVSALSYTMISMEIIWTRIFAGHFLYSFTFLVLSLAMLGMGMGGLMLRLVPAWHNSKSIVVGLLVTAGLAIVSPLLVIHWDIQFTTLFVRWTMMLRFLGVLLLLGAPFFSAGIVMALLFVTYRKELPRLYMFDLVGAATGAFIAVVLMNRMGTPAAAVLSLLPLLVAVWLMARMKGRIMVVALTCLCLGLAPQDHWWMPKENDLTDQHIHRHWDAMGLVNVFDVNDYRVITLDNVSAMAVRPFDGDLQALQNQPFFFWFDINPLIERMGSDVSLMSAGAAGGSDVLMALKNDVKEIVAVEVNPYLNHMMRDGFLTRYSGGIYRQPRVDVVTEDARTFVRRQQNRFDIIMSMSSNTMTALGNGAYAMAENYLFTVEAIEDYLNALTDRGVLIIEHKRYVPRLVSEALIALANKGMVDPQRHIAVYEMEVRETTFLMISKQSLSRRDIENSFSASYLTRGPRLREVFPEVHTESQVDYVTLVNQGWQAVAPESAIDLSPATDSRPYIAQLGLMKNLDFSALRKAELSESEGFPLAKLIVIFILLVACVLVLPLTVIPYCRRGPKMSFSGWIYFFSIGFAFMSIEVVLIQTYSLVVGYSAYTMAILLCSLLVGAGLGSRWSVHFRPEVPFWVILGWIALQVTVFRGLAVHMAVLPLSLRLLVTFVLLLPLGFFMGMPFPKGSLRMEGLVDWAMAVNGSASVIGGAGIMLVCFTYGLNVALGVGAIFYVVAMLLLRRRRAWVIPSGL